MEVSHIIWGTLQDLNRLEKYLINQNKSILNRTHKEYSKIMYGHALYKYLCSLRNNEDSPKCMIEEELKWIEREVIIEKNSNQEISYRLRNPEKYKDCITNPIFAELKMTEIIEEPRMMYESVLILLLIKFERMISQLFDSLITEFPDKYTNNRQVALTEVLSCTSFEEVRRKNADHIIDEYMRKSLKDWYGSFTSEFKLKFDYDDVYSDFREIYYRRNIVVHNHGRVNKQYLDGVEKKDGDIEIGSFLKVDNKYLVDAIDTTRKMVVKTFFAFLKICSDKAEVIRCIDTLGYEAMRSEKWSLSLFVFDLLLKEKNLENSAWWMHKFNYLLSLKSVNGIDAIKSEIEELDVSSLKHELAIAKPALLDDFIGVTQLLEIVLEKGISVDNVKEWPLFNTFRESLEYSEFVERHSSVFSVETITADDMCYKEEQMFVPFHFKLDD